MTAKSKRFEETTKKLHRLIAILRILDTRKRCTPQTLANEFKTTERNVYRDINDLNASGFSITFDKTAGTYRFTDTDFTLRDLDLNKEELMALLVGRQVAGRLGKPFENTFQSLFKKVKKETVGNILVIYSVLFFLLNFIFDSIPKDYIKTYYFSYTFFEYLSFASLLFLKTEGKNFRRIILITSAIFIVFQIYYYIAGNQRVLDSVPIGIATILVFIFIINYFLPLASRLN
jgi:hypothetical protein